MPAPVQACKRIRCGAGPTQNSPGLFELEPYLRHAVHNSGAELNARRTHVSTGVIALLSFMLLVPGVPYAAGAQPATDEYKVKAAFLYHFAQLVEWPASVPGAGDQSINLCIFADEPNRSELEDTLEGKLVGTRVLHVLLLS